MELTLNNLGIMVGISATLVAAAGSLLHLSFRAALSAFRAELLKDLNGTFVRRELCNERHGKVK